MRLTLVRVLTSVLLGSALGLGACGDSDEGGAGGTTASEPCAQSGIDSFCTCSSGARGTRTCGDDLVWSRCLCPSTGPPSNNDDGPCTEGEDVTCPYNCEGESEPRVVECLASGTFDCCPQDRGGSGGSGSSGTGGSHDDAGTPDDDAG